LADTGIETLPRFDTSAAGWRDKRHKRRYRQIPQEGQAVQDPQREAGVWRER